MPPINSSYSVSVQQTGNYTVLFADDYVNFLITSSCTATLPQAGTCTPMTKQNVKYIYNDPNSTASQTVTITPPSGNTLLGVGTLLPGENARLTSNGTSVWTALGGGGAAGTSGISGTSGVSGTSGISGTSGVSGVSGLSGSSGVSGFSGTSGLSGTSGVAGTSGVSGTSGKSGTSGVSSP